MKVETDEWLFPPPNYSDGGGEFVRVKLHLSQGKIAKAIVPLVFLCSLFLPQIAKSVNENEMFCQLEVGTINAGNQFTADLAGIDAKITCSGTLDPDTDLTNGSIMSLLEPYEESQFVAGKSKILADLSGITSEKHALYFESSAELNILLGSLTSDESRVDRSAITFEGISVDEVVYDINVENRADILVKGDGRDALNAYHSYKDGDVNVRNYGTITTEGDGYDRRTDSNPNNDMYYARRAEGIVAGIESGGGDIVVTNQAGATVHTKGDGARGIQASNDGTGNSEIHNYGTVYTEGTTWEGYRPYGIFAFAVNGDATTKNHGTITTHGYNASGLFASTNATNAGMASAENTGTITTYGELARAVLAITDGSNAGNVASENSGQITTHGDYASGVSAWGIDHEASDTRVSATNDGTVTTNGDNSGGVSAYYLIYSNTDKDAPGRAITTNSGQITVKGINTEGPVGSNAVGLSAGYWTNTNLAWGDHGGEILNSGDANIENKGTVVASGSRSTGLLAETFGTGNIKITNFGSVIAGNRADSSAQPTVEGTFGIAIYGVAKTDSTTGDTDTDVDVVILVSGTTGEVVAYAAGSDDLTTEDYDESKGIAILADSGDMNSNNEYTGHSQVDIRDGAKIRAYDSNGGHGIAAMFKGGRGTLNLIDGELVGNILFADGEHADALNIEISESGSITGDINFFGGDDTMNIDIAQNQRFVVNGDIMGLETLKKTGAGNVRINDNVNFDDSMLILEEGSLVIAGKLDLNTGTLTVNQAGKLVFEIKGTTEHGSLSAGSLHFESDSASVFAQLSADLSASDASTVRTTLAETPLRLLNVNEITIGSARTEVSSVNLQSQSSDGTFANVGTVSSEGIASFSAVNQVSRPSDSGAPSDGVDSGDTGTMMPGDSETPSASSTSSGPGGAVIGVGLLAVLLSTFMADEDASASFGDYYFSTPQSAYIASASERGVMTIKETGDKPYHMWIRTGQSAQPIRMTGVSNSGVSGTEVGFNLYSSDSFYVNTSVAPNVAAEVGSLNLTAKGEVYSLSSGWRSDRYFAGFRLSHGEFDVNSIVDNPIVNSALISNSKLQNTQAQLGAGMNINTGSVIFTPSASVQMGTFEQSEHVAESSALEAKVSGFTQDYTRAQLGLKMTSNEWLSFTNSAKWKPHLKFDSVRTNSNDAGSLTIRQSDKLGVLSFNSNAGLRSMPDVVNSLSFGAKVKSSTKDQGEWKFGFAGLEADGEDYYAAMAAYQLRF